MTTENILLENTKPIELGDPADLGRQSRFHTLYAALENAMNILGEPYDYNFLMGISGHAFRLMIYESGIYCEQPDDGQTHYFKYHTLDPIGYKEKMGSQFCDGSGYTKNEIVEAFKKSLKNGVPVLIWFPHPYWSVIIGYRDGNFLINSSNGQQIELNNIEAGGFHILEKAGNFTLAGSVRNSFKIIQDYAFRKRMPKGETTWFHKQFSGLAAYERWISHLKKGRIQDTHSNWWHYITLLDARKAALAYFKEIKKFYSGQPLKELEQLESKYELIVNCIHKNLSCFPKENNNSFNDGAIAALTKISEMEGAAFKFIKGSKLFY